MKSSRPQSFREIIDAWPRQNGLTGLQTFCADLDVPYVTGQVMRHRNSIAANHFKTLVEAAKRHGLPGITLELLHDLMEQHFTSQKVAS